MVRKSAEKKRKVKIRFSTSRISKTAKCSIYTPNHMSASFGILMKNMKIMEIHDFLTFLPSWPRHVLRAYKTNRKSIVLRGAE